MNSRSLSFQTRKAMQVHLGEQAGMELAELVNHLMVRIDELERSKVNVTRVVPEPEEPCVYNIGSFRRAA